MTMNDLYYHAKHLIVEMGVTSNENVPPRLRMQAISTHSGATKAEFELWCFAVSAVNGCATSSPMNRNCEKRICRQSRSTKHCG